MSRIFLLIIAVSDQNQMKSKMTKASHEICGEKIIDRLIKTAREIGSDKIIAACDERDRDSLADHGTDIQYIFCGDKQIQIRNIVTSFSQLLGTDEKNCGRVIILSADYPLVTAQTLSDVLDYHIAGGNACTVVTSEGSEKTALFCIGKRRLIEACTHVDRIGDIYSYLGGSGQKVDRFFVKDPDETIEVDDLAGLAKAEAAARAAINRRHMRNGVVIVDPRNTYIDENIKIGMDTVIKPGTVLEGATEIGEDCVIGPYSRLIDMKVANGVEIKYSTADGSSIDTGTTVGPYAYIRPGSEIGAGVKIGDFVEVKKSVIGSGTKISHLAYVGDAEVGRNVNVGCGSIFANYDGKKKSKTVVGDNAFIGSNSNLIAPVTIMAGAFIAAGSTITDDVPEDSFAIARSRQTTKNGYMKADRQKADKHKTEERKTDHMNGGAK